MSPQLLRIRNLAIIEETELELGPGLNVITGETGAGKSILIAALALVLGGRADAGLVRTGRRGPKSRRFSSWARFRVSGPCWPSTTSRPTMSW